MLCVVSEDTKRVITQRRMATLRELGSASSGVREEREFLDAACAVLGGQPALAAVHDRLPVRRRRGPAGVLQRDRGGPSGRARRDRSRRPPRALAGRASWRRVARRSSRSTPSASARCPPATGTSRLRRRWCCRSSSRPTSGPTGSSSPALNRYAPLDAEYRAFIDLIAQHLSAGLAAARAYDAERRRAAQLEELDRAKTAFFSNVSHEFRTPLTLMLGPLQDALGDPAGLAPERLELVHRNAMRLLKLVNGLLDFSRAEAGRMRAEFRPTDVAKLTADLASTFREATDRGGLDAGGGMRATGPAGLPGPATCGSGSSSTSSPTRSRPRLEGSIEVARAQHRRPRPALGQGHRHRHRAR